MYDQRYRYQNEGYHQYEDDHNGHHPLHHYHETIHIRERQHQREKYQPPHVNFHPKYSNQIRHQLDIESGQPCKQSYEAPQPQQTDSHAPIAPQYTFRADNVTILPGGDHQQQKTQKRKLIKKHQEVILAVKNKKKKKKTNRKEPKVNVKLSNALPQQRRRIRSKQRNKTKNTTQSRPHPQPPPQLNYQPQYQGRSLNRCHSKEARRYSKSMPSSNHKYPRSALRKSRRSYSHPPIRRRSILKARDYSRGSLLQNAIINDVNDGLCTNMGQCGDITQIYDDLDSLSSSSSSTSLEHRNKTKRKKSGRKRYNDPCGAHTIMSCETCRNGFCKKGCQPRCGSACNVENFIEGPIPLLFGFMIIVMIILV